MECLAARGFPATAMTGTAVEAGKEFDPANCLAGQGLTPELIDGQASSTSRIVRTVNASPYYRLTAGGVQVAPGRPNATATPGRIGGKVRADDSSKPWAKNSY